MSTSAAPSTRSCPSRPRLSWRCGLLAMVLSVWSAPLWSAPEPAAPASCYEGLSRPAPAEGAMRVLYVLVDQTTPLDDGLKRRILALVDDWGRRGDRMEVARFSANLRGHYPELVYEGEVEPLPDEAYLYQLRYQDKRALLSCLQAQEGRVRQGFLAALKKTLDDSDYKIPKTDLFYSLHILSEQMIQVDDAPERIVLLVSDGLENSSVTSFYRRGKVRTIDPRSELRKVRKADLLANWKGARIYAFGLGLQADSKHYLRPQTALALKAFWERYFIAGNGEVAALGTPQLMLKRLR